MRHVSVVAVEAAVAPVVSSSTQAPTRTPSHALCTSAAILLPPSLRALVVGVVVFAIVCVFGLGASSPSRTPLAAPLFALVSVCALSRPPITAFFDLLLFGWREEATWDLFEEFVGNLFGAVTNGFER
jgi:hypothetical protein